MIEEKEEILAIEINDKLHYMSTYKEAQQFLIDELGKEISIDLVFDIFNNDRYYYL